MSTFTKIILISHLFIQTLYCDSSFTFLKPTTARKIVTKYHKDHEAVYQKQNLTFQEKPLVYYAQNNRNYQNFKPIINPNIYKTERDYNANYEQQRKILAQTQPAILSLSNSNKITYKPKVKSRIQSIHVNEKIIPTTTIQPPLSTQSSVHHEFKPNNWNIPPLKTASEGNYIVKTISNFVSQKVHELKDKLEENDNKNEHEMHEKEDSKVNVTIHEKIESHEVKFSNFNKTVNDHGIIASIISERLGIKDEDGPPSPLAVAQAVGGIESLQALPQLSRTAIIKTLIVIFPFVVPLIFVPLLIISIGVLLIPIARYNHHLHYDGKYINEFDEQKGRLFGVLPFDFDFRKLARGFLNKHDCVERVACELATRISKRTFSDGWILRFLQTADKYWANRVFDALRKSDNFKDCHQFCCSPITQISDSMRISFLN